MANSLGSLVVKLALDLAEFTGGLTKAERESAKFKKSLEQGIATAASGIEIAIGAISVAAVAAAVAIDQLTKSAAHFKDLEEITGASAESLASFAVAAAVGGTSMDEVAQASIKLTKNLTGVSDESKLAGSALAALGIPIKEFKALDPAAQMETVAKALAKFADGGGKTATVLALIPKTGALLLPFFKELGQEGGKQVILTQKQIELADEYEDRQKRVRAELGLYVQAIAIKAVPALISIGNATKEFIKELTGVQGKAADLAGDNSIETWADNTARAIAFLVDAVDGVARAFQIVGTATASAFAISSTLLTAPLSRAGSMAINIAKDTAAEIDRILKRSLFSTKLEEDIAKRKRAVANVTTKRPDLNFDGPKPSDKAARAERLSDAERYLQNLEKQLEKTHDLSTAEQVVVDILSGRLKLSGNITEAQLIDVAQRIDAAKAEAKALQDAAKAEEERVRQAIHFQEIASRDLEKISESNQALKDEIAILAGGEQARRAIEKARLSSAIALKEDTLATIENAGASTIEIDALKKQIELLKERQGLFTSRNLAQDLAAQAQLIKGYNDEIAGSFANQFEAVISGKKKASDALRDFAKDVEQMVSRIAAKKIADALFGGAAGGSSGFDFGALIAKLFAGAGGFASGGSPPMNQPSLVGERGPEIFWPKTAGTIIPMSAAGKAGNVINLGGIHITVPQGTSRASSDQIGLAAARYTQRAVGKLG